MMNLEKLGLSSEDVLQRSQLSTIMGGNDDELEDGPCSVTKCSPEVRCCPGEWCNAAGNGNCVPN